MLPNNIGYIALPFFLPFSFLLFNGQGEYLPFRCGKKGGFFAHHSQADTSAKRKKMQKKNSTFCSMRPTSILKKKEKRKKKEARPTHGVAVQSRPTVGHRRSTQLRHPSLSARPSRGSSVTHVHLLQRIPDPFRVNFQNLDFSFESKNDF
jgi:hypothetical protein